MGYKEVYKDDTSIPESAELWRRIHPTQLVHDKNLGRVRPTSAGFSDSSDGTPMSVQQGSIVQANGGNPQTALARYPGDYLATLTVGQVRSQAQGVHPNPLPEDPAHTFVFGEKTDGVRKYFARNSRWIIGPDESSR